MNTKTWVRFEAVFKGDYAHQLTNIIKYGEKKLADLMLKTEEEKLKDLTEEEKLEDLIANKITEKYRFYNLENNKYTDFTTALCEKTKGDFSRLRLESTRDNDLINSLIHLVNGSGLFSTLYKCDEIWGDESSMTLLECLHDIYKGGYEPNDDVRLWIKKHKAILEKQSIEDELKLLRRLSVKRKSEITAKTEHTTTLSPAEDWAELFRQAEINQQQNQTEWEK